MTGYMEPLEAAETEMLPGACSKGSRLKPVTRPVEIWVLFMATEPLAPFLTLPDIVSCEYPLIHSFSV